MLNKGSEGCQALESKTVVRAADLTYSEDSKSPAAATTLLSISPSVPMGLVLL